MPLAWGWYGVEYVLGMGSKSQTSWCSTAVNSFPWSLCKVMGVPCFRIHSRTTASVAVRASLPQTARPPTHLVKWSCMKGDVILKGPIKSTETLMESPHRWVAVTDRAHGQLPSTCHRRCTVDTTTLCLSACWDSRTTGWSKLVYGLHPGELPTWKMQVQIVCGATTCHSSRNPLIIHHLSRTLSHIFKLD